MCDYIICTASSVGLVLCTINEWNMQNKKKV